MSYDVLDVCRFVINYSNEKGYGISNLKLQKVLYFIQAYYLSYTDKQQPCFGEVIEAWDFGPVVPVAYKEYKQFGSGDIPTIKTYTNINFEKDNLSFEDLWNADYFEYDENCINEKDRAIISSVVDKFSKYSASDLVKLTHNQAPWRSAYEKYMNNEITNESIRGYFGNGKS